MIRVASKEDWPSISDISRRSGYVDYINRIGSTYLDDGEVFVYEESEIIAFAKLHYPPDNSAWFSGLRVDPNHWKKGIGGKLTEALIENANRRGKDTLRALVFEDNFKSLKIFDNLKWKKVGTYHFIRGMPDLNDFHKRESTLTGYVNFSWEFSGYTEDKPLKQTVYFRNGWEIITPTGNTAQILKTGVGPLDMAKEEGFTCFRSDTQIKPDILFEKETEESVGILLEKQV